LQGSSRQFGDGCNHILGQGQAFWAQANESLPLVESDIEGDQRYRPLITSMKTAHEGFGGQADLQLAKHFLDHVSSPLAAELASHTQVQALIADRDAALQELDYYLKKMDGLEKEHEKLSVSVKEKEKYDRNMKKKSEMQDNFTRLNADCVRKMQERLAGRLVLIGSVSKGMLETERMLLQAINKAVGQAVSVESSIPPAYDTGAPPAKFDAIHRSMQGSAPSSTYTPASTYYPPPPPPPAVTQSQGGFDEVEKASFE